MSEQFTAAPRVVKPKKKYKQQPEQQQEDEIKLIYNNLMWDKRIVRGSTYAAIVTSKNMEIGTTTMQKGIGAAYPNQTNQEIESDSNRRADIEIFTDEFVESMTDKPPKYQYASQTNPMPQNPVIRHQMPAKIGFDIQTQIWDNELFDFDHQVQPLLHVLCGRTLEMSRLEVLQEQQLRIMSDRQQQLHLEELAQRKKIAKMYDDENKLQQQNIQRLQKYRQSKQQRIKTHRRLFSRVLAKQYLRDLKENTNDILEVNGLFRDPLELEMTSIALPKYYLGACKHNQHINALNNQAQNIIQEVRTIIIKEHAWAKQVEQTRRKQIIEKRQQQAREKQSRKKMREEEEVMRNFLKEEKLEQERLEEEKKQAEEKQGLQQEQQQQP